MAGPTPTSHQVHVFWMVVCASLLAAVALMTETFGCSEARCSRPQAVADNLVFIGQRLERELRTTLDTVQHHRGAAALDAVHTEIASVLCEGARCAHW